jgi:hypothetical protein
MREAGVRLHRTPARASARQQVILEIAWSRTKGQGADLDVNVVVACHDGEYLARIYAGGMVVTPMT